MNTKRNHLFRIFIGDRKFYKTTVAIVLPIIIQNTISNVVSLLDNVMVGQVGTLQMSAVAIVNQLMFVFYLCIFGGLAGPGIFSTQFVGAGDTKGVQDCFRLKFVIAIFMTILGVLVFHGFSTTLINKYLTESGADAVYVMGYSKDYLKIMVFGLLPFAISQVYAMTLRENGKTTLPMVSSVVAIFVNLIFNWILIFGHFGFAPMGVKGAAIATVISRFVELGIVSIVTHVRSEVYTFVRGVYKTFRIPLDLFKKVMIKGFPLLVNEFLWSSGMAAVLACYSKRGIDAVAASNIASTVNNLFNVVFLSMGNATAIMIGQALGAKENDKAYELSWKLIATTVLSSVIMGSIMFIVAPLIPNMYNTETPVKLLACDLLRVLAVMMPFFSIPHCCYFTLRAGGRTVVTFLFDSVFTWAVAYPCAWVLCHKTVLPILVCYAIVQSLDIIKGVIGIILLKNKVWIQNIVT